MRLLILVALAGFLAVPSGSQQAADSNFTLGLLNGRWWNRASEQQRLAYLSGYNDHEAYAWAIDVPGPLYVAKEEKLLRLPSGLFSDGVEALNRFYDRPQNLGIQLRAAIGIWALKSHDDIPQSEIDAITCIRRPENIFKPGACPPVAAKFAVPQ